MQRRVRLHAPHIVTIEQPVQLLDAEREHRFIGVPRPVKAMALEALVPDDEAVALMNDTKYGLTAGVYSTDKSRAFRILSAVNAGTAYWNCCDRVSPRLPWTGRKHSGIGSTLSIHGIRAFLQPKAYHLKSV